VTITETKTLNAELLAEQLDVDREVTADRLHRLLFPGSCGKFASVIEVTEGEGLTTDGVGAGVPGPIEHQLAHSAARLCQRVRSITRNE
jgi:hypothetical protein